MSLSKSLNLLCEQQDQMVKDGNIRAYIGLCMKEAALLRTTGKQLADEAAQKIFFAAANEAMKRALKFDGEIYQRV